MDASELWSDLQLCLPIPPMPEFLLRLRNILERSKDRPMSIELSQSMTGKAAARRLAEGTSNGTHPQLFPDLFSTSDRWVSLTAGAGLTVGSLLTPLEHNILYFEILPSAENFSLSATTPFACLTALLLSGVSFSSPLRLTSLSIISGLGLQSSREDSMTPEIRKRSSRY